MTEIQTETQAPSSPKTEQVNLLNALKTSFSKDSDSDAFLARAAEEIKQAEDAIIEICTKNRLRTDDNLYALLESRDAIAEQTSDIEKSTRTAAEVTSAVNNAVARLVAKIRVRNNLDAALAIAAHTRKLTRMYARIEDTIDSRRLYTAYRMLKALEEETRCVTPGAILHQLVPDTLRLRAQITLQTRKAFHSWLTTIHKFEPLIGEYALHHASAESRSQQLMLESPRSNDSYILPASSTLPTQQPSLMPLLRLRRPWSPLLTPHAVPPQPSPRSRASRSHSAHRIGKAPFTIDTNTRSDIGPESRRSFRAFVSEYKDNVPMLYLRPLLQSVLVNDGLDLLPDMRTDYRRERFAQLQRILEDTDISNESMEPNGLNSPFSNDSSRSNRIEAVVFRVCGFFVVERAVETHSSSALVSRAVVDEEWWPVALSKIKKLFSEVDDSSEERSPVKTRGLCIENDLLRFASVNNL